MADVTINQLTNAPSIVSSLLLPVTDGTSTYKLSVANVNGLAPVQSVAGKTGSVTLTNSDVGLGSVENKSSATIRGEITSSNVTTALGFTPYSNANPNGYIANSDASVAKAWVNFNGTTGTTVANEFQCTIRSAYNVSKVVRNTTGDYSVYFNNVFADANYCAIISSGSTYQAAPHAETYSASAFRFKNNYIPSNSGNTLLDSANFSVAIFR